MTTALLALLLPAAAHAVALRPVVVPKARVTVPLTAFAAQGPRLLSAGPLGQSPQLLVPAARLQPAAVVPLPVKAPAWRSAAVLRAGSFSLWDGGKLEGEEEYAYHEQRKEEKKEERRMERSLLDYRATAFYEEAAAEFLARSFDVGAERPWTGAELLTLLLTPHAIVEGLAPDPARVDLALFGKSDSDLRPVLDESGIVPTLFHETLNEAFNSGLIYRLNAAAVGKTFYGVPYPVRRLLGVAAPEAPEKKKAPAKDRKSLAESLLKLMAEVSERAADDELAEFAAQAARAAVAEGVLDESDLPEAVAGTAWDGDSLARALLTLLESAHMTGLFDSAEAVCRQAAAAGLLDEAELEQVLRGL